MRSIIFAVLCLVLNSLSASAESNQPDPQVKIHMKLINIASSHQIICEKDQDINGGPISCLMFLKDGRQVCIQAHGEFSNITALKGFSTWMEIYPTDYCGGDPAEDGFVMGEAWMDKVPSLLLQPVINSHHLIEAEVTYHVN